MATALLLGSTGMVGTPLLATLRTASPQLTNITTLTRREPPSNPDAKVPIQTHISPETSTWTPYVTSVNPPPSIMFSALATTRASAGSFQKQYTLEHDLNIELARAAKQSGTKVYVLISSQGADSNSFFGYPKMKGEIEEHVKELGFEHTVIVRPGLIAGKREETRYAEGVIRGIAAMVGKVSNGLKDFWAQDSEVIARAAVSAGLKVLNEGGEKVVVVGQSDIVRLGRTEWKGF